MFRALLINTEQYLEDISKTGKKKLKYTKYSIQEARKGTMK